MSCPSVKLCVGVEEHAVVTSTQPDPRQASWTSTSLNVANLIFPVACPTASLCLLGDSGGNVLTSTHPTGGSSAWKLAHVDKAQPTDVAHLGTQAAIFDISCPTAGLCVALDDGANVLTSTNPTGGASAWKLAHFRFTAQLSDLTCPSVSLCVAVDREGDVVTSTNPTGGASAWTVSQLDRGGYLTSLSCPTVTLCVAGDDAGNLFLGSGPAPVGVSRKAALAALAGALRHSCQRQRIATLLVQHRCLTRFTAPGAGTITLTWLSGRGIKIAAGEARTAHRGKLAVNVRLTKNGTRLLRRTQRNIRIRVKATFKDATGDRFERVTTATFVR
jgi:hypothetical protein